LLAALKQRGSALDVPLAIMIASKIAEALDYAHHRSASDGQPLGLVHGDVAPRNILLSRDGEVKLADFGIARAIGTLAPGNRVRGGTPGFIAPEAASGLVDQRSDVFSLGVTLWRALSGESAARIDLAELRARRPEVSAELVTIVEQATAPRPTDRPTAHELEQRLSVHLARYFPHVTRASLAALVRAHAVEAANAESAPRTHLVSLTQRDVVSSLGAAESPVARRTERVSERPRRTGWWFAVPAAAALVGGGIYVMQRSESDAPPVAPVAAPPVIASTPAAPRHEPAPAPSPAEGAPRDEPRPAPRRPPGLPARSSAPAEVGYLTVNAVPWGAVYVDGRVVDDETPLYRFPIAAGKHRIVVGDNPERASRSAPRDVIIKPGETREVSIKW
jgi:serine/threonine protein kinase